MFLSQNITFKLFINIYKYKIETHVIQYATTLNYKIIKKVLEIGMRTTQEDTNNKCMEVHSIIKSINVHVPPE